MSEIIKLLVTMRVDAPDVTPMNLEPHIERIVADVTDAVMQVSYQHEGRIYVDWDDPKTALLSIVVERQPDE